MANKMEKKLTQREVFVKFVSRLVWIEKLTHKKAFVELVGREEAFAFNVECSSARSRSNLIVV